MAILTPSYQRLEEEILHLPHGDRCQLATRLLESLDQDDHELSQEWQEELQKRLSDIEAGTAKLIPAEEVWKQVNQRLGSSI
jgi:putative addiction module component (TIGR02574 family)